MFEVLVNERSNHKKVSEILDWKDEVEEVFPLQALLTFFFFPINLHIRLASSEDLVTERAKIEHDYNCSGSNDSGSEAAS